MYAVRITAKGQATLAALRPAAGRVDARLLSVLSKSSRAIFIDNLRRIVAALQDRAAAEVEASPGSARAAEPCFGCHASCGHAASARSSISCVLARSRPWP